MKFSGIGGQAVIEGIMMRNKNKYAVAVRKPDQTIGVQEETWHGFAEKHKWGKWPFIRGIVSFIESLIIGIKTLMFSASFEEEEGAEPLTKTEMTWTLVIALVLAVGIFVVLPTLLVGFLKNWIESETVLSLIEGVVRLGIFIAYILIVSKNKDIQRTFMYHGAEHKCINCVEHGHPLTVENVMQSSKEHKRCGTSFLFLVVALSILLFMMIRIPNLPLKLLSRVLLVPVIASVSFEILLITGKYDNKFMRAISKPGMWMQALTTKEPTEDMVEVAIQAVEKVFDWKTFLKENFENDG